MSLRRPSFLNKVVISPSKAFIQNQMGWNPDGTLPVEDVLLLLSSRVGIPKGLMESGMGANTA